VWAELQKRHPIRGIRKWGIFGLREWLRPRVFQPACIDFGWTCHESGAIFARKVLKDKDLLVYPQLGKTAFEEAPGGDFLVSAGGLGDLRGAPTFGGF